jgi:hypothetical protein
MTLPPETVANPVLVASFTKVYPKILLVNVGLAVSVALPDEISTYNVPPALRVQAAVVMVSVVEVPLLELSVIPEAPELSVRLATVWAEEPLALPNI